jgi:hypothetical protein
MLPAFQVLDNFILILQVVANDRINVGEVESSLLLGDFFGRGSFVECKYDRVKRDTRPANTKDSCVIH